MRRISVVDELTLLANRKALKDRLHNNNDVLILIYIDINDFGTINEVYGEEFGDNILKILSLRLKNKFVEFEIYRIESDIFGLLKNDKNGVNDNTDKIKKDFDDFFFNPIIINEEKIDLCATIGFIKDKKDLLKKIELTLREAKSRKIDFLEYSDEITITRSINHADYKEMTSKIRIAIKEKRIFPVFQPIYCNTTKRITKYESLARLRTKDNEILTPDKFLKIAKKINKYNEITKIMVETTLKYFYGKNIGISLNISLEDIINEDVVDFIIEKIKKFDNPSNVTFEILEDASITIIKESINSNVLTDKNKNVNRFFNEISNLGCRIAIDDFGSGYSNFINILTLKPNIIKIDGSIIQNLNNPAIKMMAELFIDYANKINCEVIAEFVGDKYTQELICNMGISHSQGYYFGEPLEKIKEGNMEINVENLKKLFHTLRIDETDNLIQSDETEKDVLQEKSEELQKNRYLFRDVIDNINEKLQKIG